MTPHLSSETLHATTVAKHGRAVLITGRSGSGKSDLALRLLDRGFVLVSDDQTYLKLAGGRLIAAAPPIIRGKLEVRGIGIVELDSADNVPVSLVVELSSEIERLPDEGRQRLILGQDIPLISVDAQSASAPAKVEIALDLLGLKP